MNEKNKIWIEILHCNHHILLDFAKVSRDLVQDHLTSLLQIRIVYVEASTVVFKGN